MEEEGRPRKLVKLDHDESQPQHSTPATMADPAPAAESTPAPAEAHDDESTTIPNNGAALNEPTDETGAPTISKRAMKRQRRREQWEEGREQRKVKRKERIQARKERRRAELEVAKQEGREAEFRKEHERTPARFRKGTLLPLTLILDCGFDELMIEKERISLGSQLTRSYSDNSRAPFRSHLVISSFNKLLKQRFDTVLAKTYENWKGIRFLEEDFVTAAEKAKEWMVVPEGGRFEGVFADKTDAKPEEGEIVYLSSDSPHTLTELKPFSTYIIGGLVDKNRHKGICYKQAVERGIKTAKLPIGDYIQMASRQVLATNHVVEIMLKWLEVGDWGKAFMEVIPQRKGGTLRESVDESGEQQDEEAEEGEGEDEAAMFMLRNVSKYLFGDTSKESIIEIPQGQLYLVRPLSPKGYSELIFKDAAASIRRTGQEFQYQLVIQRAFEEGEEELAEDEDEEASDSLDKDEKVFLLDQALHFRSEVREGGSKILAWRDLSGDIGDLFEFVCDPSVPSDKVATFELAALQCQYERTYRRSAQKATREELQEFSFQEEKPIPSASPISSPTKSRDHSIDFPDATTAMAKDVEYSKSKGFIKPAASKDESTVAPPSAAQPEAREILTREKAELHLFDFPTGTFVQQDAHVTATVSEVGDWQYWLQISGEDKEWLGQAVVADINPVFNFEYLSFIFNAYSEDGSAYSWLLRFHDQETEERFQEGLMQALWEQLNEMKWAKVKENEKEYVLDAFQDLTMEDTEEQEAEAEVEEEESEEEDQGDGQRSEHYDSDEEEDDVVTREDDGNVNSQLAVGYKHDRSFVVRGSKIGVFKHTPNNNLEFSTNISKVETPKGKLFSPKKVMLHAEDSNMILQNGDDPNSLYRMDLEYGKIVDEWKVHDDIPVHTFAPESKFSQMTSTQSFIGASKNALFRVDPRVAGNKLVESELKQYASKNDFSSVATTEKGYIAVASNKGDIRMFDRLGINAKTHIPALGEPIIGLDVSADGRWVLATCRTYLLLIDALQKDGKNEGKLGFERSFAKDSKPQPRRLGLQPAHVAQFQHETKKPIAFTQARFNTGVDSHETSIVTATGPFIITWSLKKVIAGRKDPYTIKRYGEEVMADNFRFGSDKNVIVALPNEVNMVAKKSLLKPTRESIAGPLPMTPRRRTQWGSRLGRDDIVNSPY
ncbi:VID27-domain-containing protein [Aspergillus saccharolyticus JOP 1030-1]|uniref:tRNA (guanine(9)-N1)-methyltransferase n=1 Tax=Aspergillus saccharolyticus JOP 1030-1 TaxID=1450539 RepID=A0A318Z4D7_9EURO|nr:VID27-domain-containing protein [Aspergillus saccharolyticus JOP 1030-1]PYH41956.1 VID27-domain-containing protein [Aspergillus saccharolyticus JOP 1030-1]